MSRTAWFWITTLLVLSPVPPQVKASTFPGNETPRQHVVCNTGYTVEKCRKDIGALRRTLAKYPVAQLGEWTWILVRSEDWKPIVIPRGLDPDSPAFTYYAKRETFIEEALVTNVPGRMDELIARWNTSRERLLDLAVAHELGHAFCNDKSEETANRGVERLLDGKVPSCETNLEALARIGETRKLH